MQLLAIKIKGLKIFYVKKNNKDYKDFPVNCYRNDCVSVLFFLTTGEPEICIHINKGYIDRSRRNEIKSKPN